MQDEITIREWQKNFVEGKYDSPDFRTQCDAGWYDWFCKNTSLVNKTKKLGKIVMKLRDSKRVNLDKNYVWFKNNCPLSGPLYDDFRIADIESGQTRYTIAIDDKRENHKYNVWGKENDFKCALANFSHVRDLMNWLNEEGEYIG